MRQITTAAVLFLILTSATTLTAQELSEQERREGFVSMFNGQNFSGWQFDQKYTLPDPIPKNWTVADGVIRLSGGGRPHIGSQWSYEDFDMRFQWRSLREKYNSGFFIRSNRRVGNNQLNLAKGAEGRFFGGKMNGGPAVPKLQNPSMQWNEWRVLVVGDKVIFWCNDKLAWEGTEFASKRGHIGLQAEGAPLEFRNLRIKEIGYENLCDLKNWKLTDGDESKMQGDAIVLDGGHSTLTTLKSDYADYVLRLEWQGKKGTTAALNLRGNGDSVALNASKELDNPAGQWNYLEVHVADGKATVTQNGKALAKEIKLAAKAGPITLTHKGQPLKLRNLRIKQLEE